MAIFLWFIKMISKNKFIKWEAYQDGKPKFFSSLLLMATGKNYRYFWLTLATWVSNSHRENAMPGICRVRRVITEFKTTLETVPGQGGLSDLHVDLQNCHLLYIYQLEAND